MHHNIRAGASPNLNANTYSYTNANPNPLTDTDGHSYPNLNEYSDAVPNTYCHACSSCDCSH